MSATSPTDAWAIGNDGDGSTTVNVVAHWGGRRWTVQPNDAAWDGSQQFSGVSAKGAVGTWVVGAYYNIAAGQLQPLALRCPA